MLELPDFYKNFLVCIDASVEGIGWLLMQYGIPIIHDSKNLKALEEFPIHDLKLVPI